MLTLLIDAVWLFIGLLHMDPVNSIFEALVFGSIVHVLVDSLRTDYSSLSAYQ